MKLSMTIASLLALSVPARAQSLLGEGSSSSPYDAAKKPALKKHDHVRILVLEKARAQAGADLRTDRRSRWEVSLDDWVKFDREGGKGPHLQGTNPAIDPKIDLDARYRQDNLGRTTRQFDLTMTITSEVIDVRPNGNLVLQAIKRRKVNADEETIKLTGEVSPLVVVNGAVRSDSIANLNVSYDAEGSVGDVAKPGWLGWILGKLWPF